MLSRRGATRIDSARLLAIGSRLSAGSCQHIVLLAKHRRPSAEAGSIRVLRGGEKLFTVPPTPPIPAAPSRNPAPTPALALPPDAAPAALLVPLAATANPVAGPACQCVPDRAARLLPGAAPGWSPPARRAGCAAPRCDSRT